MNSLEVGIILAIFVIIIIVLLIIFLKKNKNSKIEEAPVKKTNIITLTMHGIDGSELVDIYDDQNIKLLENVKMSKNPQDINIESNTKFIIIQFINDNNVRDLILDKIQLNKVEIVKEKAIQAQLNFNPTTNTERYNAVLNGKFHWGGGTKYRINLE